MKTKNTRLAKFTMFAAVLSFAALFSSCSDDDKVDAGSSVNVKVVNAGENASNQDFFIEGTKIASAVSEGQSTNYITTTNSGSDRNVEFRASGSSEVYASMKTDLKENKNYTFILSGTGSSARIIAMEDDLTAPSSGKAKVRFIHASSAAPENVDIYTINGEANRVKIATVGRYQASSFTEIDPSFGVGVVTAGSTDLGQIQTLSFGSLQAGHIYTILVSGSTQVTASAITHN